MRARQLSWGSASRTAAAGGSAIVRSSLPPAVSSHIVRLQQHQQQATKYGTSVSAVPDGSDDQAFARDELADYEELLRQKKAAKQQALEAAIRKRKVKTAAQQQQQQQAASLVVDSTAAERSSADSGSSTLAQPPAAAAAAGPSAPTGARFTARSRVVPTDLRQQQRSSTRASPVLRSPAAAEAADADIITETSAEGLPSDDVLKAMLEELLDGEPLEEEGETESNSYDTNNVTQQRRQPAGAALRRRTPAQIRAAAVARRAAQRQLLQEQQQQSSTAGSSSSSSRKVEELVPVPKYVDRQLAQLAASDPNAAALQQMLAAAAAGDEDDEDEMSEAESANDTENDDDLDWEALGQYEQLEQYLGDLQKQQVSPKQPSPAAATPVFPTPAGSGHSGSSSSVAKPQSAPKKLKRVPAGTAAKQFERDLDELEQFVSLFEAMEKSKPGSSSDKLQRPQQAAADPGEALVAALLGEDWEAELLDELASVVDDDEDDGQTAAAAGSSEQQQSGQLLAAAAEEDEDEEPWADDVTALLLGLVTISHEKYLKGPIPLLEKVSEEQRCSAFWSAPWALLVTDDSGQYNMEYVNEAAGRMLGGGYLDLFGQPAFELVANSLEAQSDWAYAVQRVEESVVNAARLSQLELRDLSGQPVVARDIIMWRVDSLEDTPIGMAVLISNWERKKQ